MDEKRRRFEAQVLTHLDAAYRYARWLTRVPHEADDVLQDATLRAFRSFQDLRGTDGKAWFLTIVRNCHLTAVRQRQAPSLVPLPDEEGPAAAALPTAARGPEEEAIRSEEQRTLQRLMSALAPEHREVLALRELEDMDYRAIASVTGVPIGTVMSRLARARAALRARWLLECGRQDGLR